MLDLEPMRIGSRTFDFSRPYVVGILNVTPDSFYDGGHNLDAARATEHAARLEAGGADIIDVGGESTRPGSKPVGTDVEANRVLPVIRAVRRGSDIPISIDTTKGEIARAALDEGADLINDTSALRFDPAIADLAAGRDVPLVLMHSRNEPATMQKLVHYDDLFGEIRRELEHSIGIAVARGVARTRIIVDPGIGFGKTPRHNLEILADPGFLAPLGLPVLLGPSNKSFIGAVTDAPVDERTGGTAASVAAAVLAGVHFLRVHDVQTMGQAARVAHAIWTAGAGDG
jgi:dihydropteroate synthase